MTISEETRVGTIAKIDEIKRLLEAGDDKAAGRIALEGLAPIARDLKTKYGPMVKMLVRSWVNKILD